MFSIFYSFLLWEIKSKNKPWIHLFNILNKIIFNHRKLLLWDLNHIEFDSDCFIKPQITSNSLDTVKNQTYFRSISPDLICSALLQLFFYWLFLCTRAGSGWKKKWTRIFWEMLLSGNDAVMVHSEKNRPLKARSKNS